MLSTEQLTALVQILHSQDQTFNQIEQLFHNNFTKNEYLRLTLGLKILQDDKFISTSTEYLITYFLVYLIYKEGSQQKDDGTEEICPNTLSQLVQRILEIEDENQKHKIAFSQKQKKTEEDWRLHAANNERILQKFFILKLISGRANEIANITPFDYATKTINDREFLSSDELNILQELKKKVVDKELENSLGGIRKKGISPIIEITKRKGKLDTITKGLNVQRFEPQFVRHVPELVEIDEDELFWLNPEGFSHEITWDSSMCSESERNSEFKELFSNAFKQKLLPIQQQQIQGEIEANLNMLYKSGLTPNKFPDLVENNPEIAIFTLMKLIDNQSPHVTEYFTALVNMPMSLQSMDIVNKLTTSSNLPIEFLHTFIINCITSCENIKDKISQTRQVRLASVFLQSLLRNNIINVQDILYEVKTFCINFIKVKEAVDLFQLLEQLSASNKSSSS